MARSWGNEQSTTTAGSKFEGRFYTPSHGSFREFGGFTPTQCFGWLLGLRLAGNGPISRGKPRDLRPNRSAVTAYQEPRGRLDVYRGRKRVGLRTTRCCTPRPERSTPVPVSRQNSPREHPLTPQFSLMRTDGSVSDGGGSTNSRGRRGPQLTMSSRPQRRERCRAHNSLTVPRTGV